MRVEPDGSLLIGFKRPDARSTTKGLFYFMALRDQPYLPLYIQDFLTDEKLAECSASACGVYIRIMCLMHKSDEYGTILLRQKDKQSDNQIKNFASKIAKFLPYSEQTFFEALTELVLEKVLCLDEDKLIQKRMVYDNGISLVRSKSGKKGGIKSNFGTPKQQAKVKANAEYEIEYEIEDTDTNKNEQNKKFVLSHDEIITRLKENEYEVQEYLMRTYQFLANEYLELVDIFVGEKTAGKNELDLPYTEVVRYFKSWVSHHNLKYKKLFKSKKQENGTKKGHDFGNIAAAAADYLARHDAGEFNSTSH